MAILDFTDRIQLAVDGGEIALGLFLDLSKAFNMIDHNILLGKLSYYGIQDNEAKWFRSYLSKGKQFVSIHGTDSDLFGNFSWFSSSFKRCSVYIKIN